MPTEEGLLKVLIVDDELPIRQRLRLYDWSACGAVVVDEAANGEVALDLCSKWLPDIVLTDIVMPVMNGLDFLRMAAGTFPDTKIVLLTSHTDFDYVHQALKLGAVDYLIKVSLHQHELENVIRKARERLVHDQSIRVHRQELVRKRQAQLFRQMMASPDEECGRLLPDLIGTAKPPEAPFRFIRVFAQTKRDDQITSDEVVRSILQDTATREGRGEMLWFPIHLGDYFILPHPPGQQRGADLEAAAERLIRDIARAVEERLSFLSGDIELFAALSAEVHQPEQLRSVFRETFHWLNEHFYEPKQLVFSGHPAPMQGLTAPLQAQMKAHMLRYSSSQPALVSYLRSGFADWIRSLRIYPNEVKSFAVQLLNEWCVGAAAKLEESASLQEMISGMIHLLEQTEKGTIRPEVRMAKRIIDEKLGEALTLAMVAEEVELSADYLGKLFQEQLGESFKDYVTRCRIERASALLRDSTMKVYAIAEAVGFPNYRYFSTLFRKITGMSPTDVKRGEQEGC